MPYRVYIDQTGSFRAVKIGADPQTVDIKNSFECQFWHSFEKELQRRLLKEFNDKGEQDEKR